MILSHHIIGMNVVFRYANRTNSADDANDFYIHEPNLQIPPGRKYKVKLNSCCTYADNTGIDPNSLVNGTELISLRTEFIELRIGNIGSTNCFENGNNDSLIFFMDNKFNPSTSVGYAQGYWGQRDSVMKSDEEFVVEGLHFNNIRFRLLNERRTPLLDDTEDESPPANLVVSLYIEPIDD